VAFLERRTQNVFSQLVNVKKFPKSPREVPDATPADFTYRIALTIKKMEFLSLLCHTMFRNSGRIRQVLESTQKPQDEFTYSLYVVRFTGYLRGPHSSLISCEETFLSSSLSVQVHNQHLRPGMSLDPGDHAVNPRNHLYGNSQDG
jgi:hypothetical protein